jgi:putative peptidoglycan lipid II flippase
MRGFRLRHPGVRKIATLMLPRTLGLGVFQLNQVVITAIASTIATGSIAVFTLAFDVVSVPINVFGISLAVAAFPVFSRAAAEKDTQAFVAHFSTNVRRVLFLLLPTSVLFLMLRAQLVRVLYGAGEFGWDATYLTAQAVAYFSISLLAQSLIPLLARSFYAYQDTKTPVFVSIGSVALNIVLGIFFSRSFGILGLVAAFSFAAVLQMLVLLVLLRIRIGDLDDRRILFSFARILFASAGMGLVVWGMKWFVAAHVDMQTFAGILTQGAAAGAVGVLAYLLFAVLLRAEEVRLLSQWINKTRNFLRNGRH